MSKELPIRLTSVCGDYNSGGLIKKTFKRFLKEKDAFKHFPADGEGTLSGVIVEANKDTGLAKKISRLIIGGSLIK